MSWIMASIYVATCVICAMLGLTAGINLNPASSVSFLWDWNAAGSWVSGIGTLLAVFVSLQMARRGEKNQAEREKEKLNIDIRVAGMFAHLHIVSLGHHQVTVKDVLIGRRSSGAFNTALQDLKGNDIVFPIRISFREDIHASWRIDSVHALLDAIRALQPFTLNELTVEVMTSMDVYVVPVDANFAAWIQDAANRQGISLLSPR